MTNTIEQPVEFVPLLNFENDYEILSTYPFTIRKASNHRQLSESIKDGYVRVSLNNRPYYKHRLIALQFIPNNDPINNDVVDHINHDRTDNHIENLRWCSLSDNNYNKSSNKGVQYQFIDDIPDDAIVVDYYNVKNDRRVFEENKYYYYHNDETDEDVFYGRIDEHTYRILHINILRSGHQFVSLRDVNNRQVCVYINRFKYQHDLL